MDPTRHPWPPSPASQRWLSPLPKGLGAICAMLLVLLPDPTAAAAPDIVPQRREHEATASEGHGFSISSDAAWTVSSQHRWIRIGSSRTGRGDAVVIYDVERNQSRFGRSGSILVASPSGTVSFTVRQKGTSDQMQWPFETGGTVVSSPAIGRDGTVHVGSSDGFLYAIHPDGTLRWKFETGDPIYSSPAISADGTVHIGSLGGNLHAVGANGAPLWRFPTGGGIRSSPAIGPDGAVYVGSSDGRLYAIYADGTLRWSFQTGDEIRSAPVIGEDGAIYFGSDDFHFYAVNPDGSLRWKFETGDAISHSAAIAPDGTLYFGSYDEHFYAVSPDGTRRWRFAPGNYVSSSPVIGEDGVVYFGSADLNLYALRPDGSLLWDYETFSTVGSPALAADGSLYFHGWDLYVLDSNGVRQRTFQLSQQFASPPAISVDGTIYIGSGDGNVHAIEGTSPLADSPWPKFRRDLRNTGSLAPRPVSFPQWAGGISDPNRRGPFDRIAGERHPNLLRFAFGLEPLESARGGLFEKLQSSADGFAVAFRRDATREGFQFKVERSAGLSEWETIAEAEGSGPLLPVQEDEVTVAEKLTEDATKQTVFLIDRDSGGAPHGFLRVSVTEGSQVEWR